METGVAFMQRMREDAEFREKVNAFVNIQERLAFLKSEGYDFTPFMQILDNLSSNWQSAGGLGQPANGTRHTQGPTGFLGRIRQIFRPTKVPRLER